MGEEKREMRLASRHPFSLPEEVVSKIDSFLEPSPFLVCGCGRSVLGVEKRRPKVGRITWKEAGGKLHVMDEEGELFSLDPCCSTPLREEVVETGRISGMASHLVVRGRRYSSSCEKLVMQDVYHLSDGTPLCSLCWFKKQRLKTALKAMKKQIVL